MKLRSILENKVDSLYRLFNNIVMISVIILPFIFLNYIFSATGLTNSPGIWDYNNLQNGGEPLFWITIFFLVIVYTTLLLYIAKIKLRKPPYFMYH